MLNDKSRIHSYKNAIFSSKEKFRDKTVMDVGAGTGMLQKYKMTIEKIPFAKK